MRVKAFIYDFVDEKIVEAKLQEFGYDAFLKSYLPIDDLLSTVPVILGWEKPKVVNEPIKILSLKVKDGKSIDAQKKNFEVFITLDNTPNSNTVELTIDGKTITAVQNSKDIYKINEFVATVEVSFSTIVKNEEIYSLTANLKNVANKIIDTKVINVKVLADGSVSETNEKKTKVDATYQNITLEQLISFGVSKKLAIKYLDTLNKTFIDYEINTSTRISHFMAQVLHESAMLYYTAESGATDSDYKGYKGRGLLMLTTLKNYKSYGIYENEDFTSSTKNKEKLENIPYSARSAGWFWSIYRKLNSYADDNDFIYCTYIVNGGFNGCDDRVGIIENIFKTFKIDFQDFSMKESNIYNSLKGCFAWGLWHDPAISSRNFNTCENDKTKAIEGYTRFLELVPNDFEGLNWYNIHLMEEFSNLKYIENKKVKVNETDAAKQRLKKLAEL